MIKVHDQGSGEVEEVEWEKDEFEELPVPARNIARVYEAFRLGGEGLVGFEEAVGRHEMLGDMYRAWDEGKQGREAGFLKK